MALTKQEVDKLEAEGYSFDEIVEADKKSGQSEQKQETIPQMLLGNLKEAGVKTSASAANVLNSMLLGAPQMIAQKGFGQNFVNEADLSGGEGVTKNSCSETSTW